MLSVLNKLTLPKDTKMPTLNFEENKNNVKFPPKNNFVVVCAIKPSSFIILFYITHNVAGHIELWPSFQVEKITNMKNRAYVFQITTPNETVCLSSDEQRNMDIFVFFLQIQTRLKDQIRGNKHLKPSQNSDL